MVRQNRTGLSKSGFRAAGLAAGIAAAVVLTGCGGAEQQAGPAQDQAPQESTVESSPSPEPTTEEKTEPAQSSEAKATKPRPPKDKQRLCKSADLRLSLGRGDAGAGTHWRPLRFTNAGDSPCVIQGFPGVSFVADDDGHQVGAAAYRDGKKGPAITLQPGETAHAPVGFTQIHNFPAAECKPTAVRGLRVYPPQETASMFLEQKGTGCANADINGYQLKVQTIRPGAGM